MCVLAFLSNGDPGLAVGPASDHNLEHVRVVLWLLGQRHSDVIVRTRREGDRSDVTVLPDVLEFVLVGCRQVDSL